MTGPLAQTYLSIEEIDTLARGLAVLAGVGRTFHVLHEMDAQKASGVVWRLNPKLGPMATHLAELRMQLE